MFPLAKEALIEGPSSDLKPPISWIKHGTRKGKILQTIYEVVIVSPFALPPTALIYSFLYTAYLSSHNIF